MKIIKFLRSILDLLDDLITYKKLREGASEIITGSGLTNTKKIIGSKDKNCKHPVLTSMILFEDGVEKPHQICIRCEAKIYAKTKTEKMAYDKHLAAFRVMCPNVRQVGAGPSRLRQIIRVGEHDVFWKKIDS